MAGTPDVHDECHSAEKRLSELVRSDFWFLDGNIVVVSGMAAFKVHRGLLERHSEVFNDLFSIPQPEDQALIDGCYWVELHDHPSDVFYFLSALYDGLYFKNPRANDFPAIAAVLRLSTKYLVEHLRQRCLVRLDSDWPSTLNGWDLRENEATDELGRYVPRDLCPHPILVVELALEMDLTHILPAAMYDLSRYGPSKILAGTSAPPPSVDFPSEFDLFTNKKKFILSRAFLHQTLQGRENAQRYVATFIAKEVQNRLPSVECANRHDEFPSRPCHESFYFIMLNILRSVGGIACGRDADPLFTLVQATDMLSRTDFSDGQRQCGLRMCHPCKVDFAASAGKAREEVWGLLSQWFGLTDNDKTMDLSA